MKWIAISIGILGLLLTVKPFIRSANWFIRLGDFPRLQILFLLIVSLILFFFYFNYTNVFDLLFVVSITASIIYQIIAILPFTILYPKEVENAKGKTNQKTNISLLIFNVLMENENYKQVSDFIKEVKADVVLLAEPNKVWDSNLSEVKKAYKYEVSHLLDNHYGMMLFSNLELHETEIQFLIQDDIPSIHTKIKLPSGDDIAFHGVHPRPPVPEEKGRSTERDGELLLVGKAVKDSNLPTIVAGDLNDVAWSASTLLFKKVSGLLDPRIGRGFYNTFHAKYPIFRLPLDHIFHSNHFRLIDLKVIKTFLLGSDHFPVYLKLSYEKDAQFKQKEEESATSEEVEDANGKIQEALIENQAEVNSEKEAEQKIEELKAEIIKEE